MSRALTVLAPILLLGGCVIGGNKYPRPRDLTPDWKVDRMRLLGIRSEPAEARPGDVVTFEALIGTAVDDATELAVIWLACPLDYQSFGCTTDLGGIDVTTATPDDLASIGFIGFEPGLPPVYTVPTDLLDDLEPEARAEGAYVFVQTLALPMSLLEDEAALDELDFSVVASGYKRLVVSEAQTPNHNPDIGLFTVDGIPVPAGATVRVDPEQSYDIGILLPEGARETYTYINSLGGPETRVEEPYVSWYTTDGEMTEEVTLWPYLDATWIAPAEVGTEGRWYAVLRDRRGGMSWYVQPWVAGEADAAR